jgi:hypothetical protein
MSTIAEIRLNNLESLIAEFGTQEAVANRGQTSPIYLSQVRNKAMDSKTGRSRQMGDRLARKLEIGCDKPPGWMDHAHGQQADQNNHFKPLGRDALAHVSPNADEPQASYLRAPETTWPFELFSHADWMTLGEKERHEFEGPIAIAIMRLRKLRQA